MDNIKFKKNNERFNGYGNVYDVYHHEKEIGYVERGRENAGYWGAWEGVINGIKVVSDSRENTVREAI